MQPDGYDRWTSSAVQCTSGGREVEYRGGMGGLGGVVFSGEVFCGWRVTLGNYDLPVSK